MFRFQSGGEIIEIIVRDEAGTKVDSFKCKMKDSDNFRKILYILKNKYSFKPFDKKEKKDRDIDWLKKQNI